MQALQGFFMRNRLIEIVVFTRLVAAFLFYL
jgi:hypothetical protein